MKKIAFLFILSIVALSCSVNKNLINVYESENLKIKPLNGNIFMHISYLNTNDFGKVACNGMVYINGDEAIIFDTPIDDKASLELINWIQKKQSKQIKAIVVTHFHEDCLGGLSAFHENGIQSYASNKTIELVKKEKLETLPKLNFEDKFEFKIGKELVHATYYGEGHTKDNVVGYIPKEQVLFGGCLIKSVGASKGYLGDANTVEWSKTVEKIKADLPDLKIIIPGHGKSGDEALLDYTIQLFKNIENKNKG